MSEEGSENGEDFEGEEVEENGEENEVDEEAEVRLHLQLGCC